MITTVFDLCVRLIEWLAGLLGTTYVAINVWIFCVIWPLLTVGLIVVVVMQHKRIRSLQSKNEPNLSSSS